MLTPPLFRSEFSGVGQGIFTFCGCEGCGGHASQSTNIHGFVLMIILFDDRSCTTNYIQINGEEKYSNNPRITVSQTFVDDKTIAQNLPVKCNSTMQQQTMQSSNKRA